MKLLITTPDVSKKYAGGVPNYYLKLQPYSRMETDYFTVGRRAQSSGMWLEPLRLLKDYWNFVRLLKRGNHDVIIINPSLEVKSLLRESIFLLLAKVKCKNVIVFIRGWRPSAEEMIRRYGRSLFCVVYGRADAVIVLATEFRDTLTQWGFQKTIFVESTIVEEDAFTEPTQRSSHAGGDADGACRILFLSRLLRTKGVYLMLAAYRIVQATQPSVTLTIAGDGPELEPAKEYVKNHEIPGVDFPGYLRGAEKRAAYERADIFFLPTQHGEGMPNTVLEAMAYGLPVVTRSVGGINDFFQDGVMGFTTESRDPETFVQLIERLITEPQLRARMGRYNRSYAQKHFVASKVAIRLEAICANVLSGNNQTRFQAWYEYSRRTNAQTHTNDSPSRAPGL